MILIAAGSSLPFCGVDSQQIVLRAFSALGRVATLREISALYETPAWPDANDPPFINAVASIETALSPEALLQTLHAIEAGFGRRRRQKNAPRSLDLDLIAYHRERRESGLGGLELPHPRLADREFVLAPLAQIAPDWRHPVTGATAQAMLEPLSPHKACRIS